MKHFSLLLLLGALPLACSTGPRIKAADQPVRQPPAKSLESQYVANAERADAVAEVHFERGSAHLAPEEVEKLRKTIAHALQQARLKEAKVVAWADSEYPGKKGQDLPAAAQKLAAQRAEDIRATIAELTGLPKDKTEVFNMAVRPKTLDSILHEEDSRVKEDFEEAGLRDRDSHAPRFAGKAVVMLVDEDRPSGAVPGQPPAR